MNTIHLVCNIAFSFAINAWGTEILTKISRLLWAIIVKWGCAQCPAMPLDLFNEDPYAPQCHLHLLLPSHWLIQVGGGPREALPLSAQFFIFMQFSAKILPNNRFLPQIQGWRPPCIWDILDPPLPLSLIPYSDGSSISPRWGCQPSRVAPTYDFAKMSQNYMKLKEFGRGGAHVPRAIVPMTPAVPHPLLLVPYHSQLNGNMIPVALF